MTFWSEEEDLGQQGQQTSGGIQSIPAAHLSTQIGLKLVGLGQGGSPMGGLPRCFHKPRGPPAHGEAWACGERWAQQPMSQPEPAVSLGFWACPQLHSWLPSTLGFFPILIRIFQFSVLLFLITFTPNLQKMLPEFQTENNKKMMPILGLHMEESVQSSWLQRKGFFEQYLP